MAVAQPKQASSATTSLIYITIGALTVVWTIIRYIYLGRHEGSDNAYLWTHGFLLSGIVLLIIGLAIGHIGRAARGAEVVAAPAVPAQPAIAAVPDVPATAATAAPNTVVPNVPVAPAVPNQATLGTPTVAPATQYTTVR